MRIGRLVPFSLLIVGSAMAQPTVDTTMKMSTAWQYTVESSINAAQSSYSDSWVGGEVGSLTWAFNSRIAAWKLIAPRVEDRNTLKLSFGQTLSQVRDEATGAANWQEPSKSTDLIDFESVFRFLMNSFVDPYAALRIESRFTDESIDGFRRYFTPTTFTQSAGIMRVIIDKPKKVDLRSRLGLALRETMVDVVTDVANKQSTWETTTDGGVESVTDFTASLQKNLSYNSKLSLFQAFFNSRKDELPNDFWKTVDMNWEHQVSASISRYVQTYLYFQLLFDKEIIDKLRVKQTLGVGLSWKTQG